MPPERGGVLQTEAFLKQGRKIVDQASNARTPLGLIGGIAVRVHSEECGDLAKRLARLRPGEQEHTDLDLMSYG